MTDYTTAAIDAVRQALNAEQQGFADWLCRVLAASAGGVEAGPEGVPVAPPGSWQAECVAALIAHGEALALGGGADEPAEDPR